ncbi:hypothetical protein SASPL_127050 [Salvia splendens]|uniref:Retrotransposon gag domain-containing protein n=1 Tax=Salvia splendens TaxID=180675 RepID=A0A8X8XGT2_SALSN|nr:hypothetical protein SASPL_127050 [Salvia splendens]
MDVDFEEENLRSLQIEEDEGPIRPSSRIRRRIRIESEVSRPNTAQLADTPRIRIDGVSVAYRYRIRIRYAIRQQGGVDYQWLNVDVVVLVVEDMEIPKTKRLHGNTSIDANSDSDLSNHDDDDGNNPFAREKERDNMYYGADPTRDIGMRIEIPEFEGKTLPNEFIDWLNTVERVFDIKNISDNNKVKLVAIKLKKHASIWWEHVKRQRVRERKAKIQSWEKMKKLLWEKFLPPHYPQDAFIEYHVWKQGDLSVEDFTNDFDRLRMRCDVEEEEEQTIACYFGALRSEISDVVQLQQYFCYEDVCRLALKVEKQLKGRKAVSYWSGRDSTNFCGSGSGTRSSKPVAPVAAKPQITSKPVESGSRSRQPVRCLKCQGFAHMQADCPNRHMVTFSGEEETTPIFDESEDESSNLDGDVEEV